MRLALFTFVGTLFVTGLAASACSSGSNKITSSAGTGGTGGGTAETTSSSSSSSSSTASSSSSSGAGTGGNDPGKPSTTYPAPYQMPPPTVVDNGGPVIASPKFVPIFFSNEDPTMKTKLTDFVKVVGGTKYWTATTSEYGVGPATSSDPVLLTESAPQMIQDSEIQTWLAGKLNANDALFPKPDSNTLYIIHYPAGTGITQQGQGGTMYSCQSFGGYHGFTTLDSAHGTMNVPYAVIPRCGNFDGFKGIDAVTATESHEMIEAVTDPFPDPSGVTTAYGYPDPDHIYWLFANLGGGEVGDMCAQIGTVDGVASAFAKFTEMPYLVQRTWSNAASLAGKDPCVPPLPGEVYFAAVPKLPDTYTNTVLGTMNVVRIGVGKTKTVEIDLISEGDTGGPWTVDVQDVNAWEYGPTQAHLDLKLDRTTGQNGEKLYLTITPLTAGQFGVDEFILTSTLGSFKTVWVGAVAD